MDFLIVDDSKAMQTIIAKSLVSIGYIKDHIRIADTAEDAMRLIQEATPDLVLSDLNMPGMSGLDLLEIIRKERIPTHFGLISLELNEVTRQRANFLGADFTLEKPFTSEALFTAITSCCSSPVAQPTRNSSTNWPSPASIARLLSTISRQEVQLNPSAFNQLHDSNAPFVVASFQDRQKKLRASIVLDFPATQCLQQLLGKVANGISAEQEPITGTDLFIELLCPLISLTGSEELLNLHARHDITNPSTSVRPFLELYRNRLTTLQLFRSQVAVGIVVFCRH